MTAFSDAFRVEAARIARKEFKDDIAEVRKLLASQRSEISALKKENKALAAEVKVLRKRVDKSVPAPAQPVVHGEPRHAGGRKFVFRPEVLAAKRAAIGITQRELGQLLDASLATVNKWESGKAAPRAAQLERIRTVLAIGVREARARLADIQGKAETA